MEISKPASKPFYKPELDGLRFFAFLLVFIHHHSFTEKVAGLSLLHKIGWIGVDLFFVLSAYLFTKLLVLEFYKTKTISYKKFFLRRIFRIWPVYFIFILFCLAVNIFIGRNLDTDVLLRLGGLLTFTDNIVSVFHGYNSAIPFVAHLWTISFEEQFYLIVPLLILFLVRISQRQKLIFFFAVFIALNILRFYLISKNVNYLALWVLPFTHFESILFGIILGFFDKVTLKIKPIFWLILSIVCGISISSFDIAELSYHSALLCLLTGVSMVSVVTFTLNSSTAIKFLSNKFLVFLGKRSYGLYLFHLVGNKIGGAISNHIFNSLELISFIISLTTTIGMAVISYSVIEKPFLKLKKKYEIVKSRPI